MLDLFTIFTKGGMVLWFFRGTNSMLTQPVNSLIENSIIMQRTRTADDSLAFKFKVDSELGVVFLLAHQKILLLNYADKLLDDVQVAFKQRFASAFSEGDEAEQNDYSSFDSDFQMVLQAAEQEQHQKKPTMKTFSQSGKFSKTSAGAGAAPSAQAAPAPATATVKTPEPAPAVKVPAASPKSPPGPPRPRGARKPKAPPVASTPPTNGKKVKGKEKRSWQDSKLSTGARQALDYSADPKTDNSDMAAAIPINDFMQDGPSMVGPLTALDNEEYDDGEEEEACDDDAHSSDDAAAPAASSTSKASSSASGGGGVLGFFKGLVSSKVITKESLAPVLDKMKEHLVSKNVAQEISQSLCDSVAEKLEGRAMGTFGSVSSTVRSTLEDSLVQILTAGGSHDTLREVMAAKKRSRPYVITFCGVNGVGKSTNLAKIAFWLLQNGHRVLVAACDTFRAGALEQLRVHVQRLHAQHPASDGAAAMIQLYERGYGRDPAGIASDAIGYAKDEGFDVVLVDTAGRMQDDEPLMRALAKLIKCNTPDLVLFVGEALVGNEAVDQLSKFNTALVDHGDGRLQVIDGVLLTKFDTVDDKMGAAVSMAYTSRKPIMFVGTGQTYRDLKSLNASSVVKALLR
ncbi:signal recognition particle receptor subunit alpha-like [Sycon ciliatum]|uniref:signal recognition particle receptor subunit alpha-like n=1 Tax=Sycon ciliatum TaxID=27933 RepID=UPI0031F6465F